MSKLLITLRSKQFVTISKTRQSSELSLSLLFTSAAKKIIIPSVWSQIAVNWSSVRLLACRDMSSCTICFLASPSGNGTYSRLTNLRRAASSISCGLQDYQKISNDQLWAALLTGRNAVTWHLSLSNAERVGGRPLNIFEWLFKNVEPSSDSNIEPIREDAPTVS